MQFADKSVLLFMALIAIYSPLASLSAYFPIVSRLGPAEQRRLAIGVFIRVTIFVLVALWIGEPLLGILGISTAALTVTGGIALLYVGVPLMRGSDLRPKREEVPPTEPPSWRSMTFVPTTFPITVGGTTFAILVSFSSLATEKLELVALSVAAIAYAAVTGLTVYAAGHVHRRTSDQTRMMLERIAGILLTALAVSLLANGAPRMVVTTLEAIDRGEDVGQTMSDATDDD